MDYIKERLDNLNFWIGVIGLVLYVLGFHSLLVICFIAMIVLPEKNFRIWTTKGAAKIREYDSKS